MFHSVTYTAHAYFTFFYHHIDFPPSQRVEEDNDDFLDHPPPNQQQQGSPSPVSPSSPMSDMECDDTDYPNYVPTQPLYNHDIFNILSHKVIFYNNWATTQTSARPLSITNTHVSNLPPHQLPPTLEGLQSISDMLSASCISVECTRASLTLISSYVLQ